METKYNFSSDDWEMAKEKMRHILIEVAKKQETISYSELAAKLSVKGLEPESYALGNMLGEISLSEDANDRGMLSVVVVHKYGDKKPGGGFFELAKELGYDITNKEEFWISELKKVYEYWPTK